MAAAEEIQNLRMLSNERAIGRHIGSDRLIQAGVNALLTGIETPSVPLLAGLGRNEESQARELFDRVLDELGLSCTKPARPSPPTSGPPGPA